MTVRLNPYLSFRDTARQAMEYYHSIFGGELHLNTFAELHASEDPAEQDKIMHGMVDGDHGIVLMGADTPNAMEFTAPAGFAISLSGDEQDRLRGYWEKLSDGGTVTMPLEKAPWGDTFGMCTDRFGIGWMVNIAGG
jgi:PhnB protein